MSSLLSFRSKRDLRSKHTDWSCLPCTDPAACFGSYENIYINAANCFKPHSCTLTDSQAMDQAMAIAAEYVHIADQYPVLTTTEREIAAAIRDTNNMFFSNAAFTSGSDSARTSSSSDSSATRHELSSADIAQSFDFIEKTLPMPIHSTRSHRAHSQSTTCNTNIDSLYGSVAMTSKITKQTHVDERPRALSKIKHSIKRHGRNLRSVFS